MCWELYGALGGSCTGCWEGAVRGAGEELLGAGTRMLGHAAAGVCWEGESPSPTRILGHTHCNSLQLPGTRPLHPLQLALHPRPAHRQPRLRIPGSAQRQTSDAPPSPDALACRCQDPTTSLARCPCLPMSARVSLYGGREGHSVRRLRVPPPPVPMYPRTRLRLLRLLLPSVPPWTLVAGTGCARFLPCLLPWHAH